MNVLVNVIEMSLKAVIVKSAEHLAARAIASQHYCLLNPAP